MISFEELNKKIVALRMVSIDFDYSKLKVSLTVKPEYGFSSEFANKKIRFTFSNCVFFATTNLSTEKYDTSTEVISWGKKKDFSVLKNFVSVSIAKDFNKSNLSNLDYKNLPDNYEFYFFENVFGDLINIVSNNVSVEY